jgi:hypothetical protein
VNWCDGFAPIFSVAVTKKNMAQVFSFSISFPTGCLPFFFLFAGTDFFWFLLSAEEFVGFVRLLMRTELLTGYFEMIFSDSGIEFVTTL